MIYTTDMGFANESGSVAPVSAIDAIMDIYESAIEYNQTSFLYEGVADNAKNFVRNLGTRIVDAINGMIRKVKEMIMSKAFKTLESNVKSVGRGDKSFTLGTDGVELQFYNASAITAGQIDTEMKAVKEGSKSVSDAKADIKSKLKKDDLFKKDTKKTLADAYDAVNQIKKDASALIGELDKIKKTALTNIKGGGQADATGASNAASYAVYAANALTNKVMSNCIKNVNMLNGRFARAKKKKED